MSEADFQNLLQSDRQSLSRLLAVLEEELEALRQQELPRLEALLTEKRQLLDSLEQGRRLRSRLLEEAGHEASLDGLRAWAQGSPQLPSLLALAADFEQDLEHCQQLNQRNGRVIRSSQHATGQLLNLLRGEDSPNLYDRQGAARSGNDRRPLSQA